MVTSAARRAVGAAAVVMALVATTTGCLVMARDYAGPEAAPAVLVHGDSLTYRAEVGHDSDQSTDNARLLTTLLADRGHRVTVQATAGATAAAGTTLVDQWPGLGLDVPQVAVIALGSNDVAHIGTVLDGTTEPVTVGDATAGMDAYLTALDELGVECISVLTVATRSEATGLTTYGPQWNDHLRTHPLVDHVQDWQAVADAHPWIFDPDQIHFLAALGGELYRAELLAAADACTG